MEFLMNQVSSKIGDNMLIEDIFINHSFNKEHFFKIRKRKEAIFDLKDNVVTEQSISTSEGAIINKVIENLKVLEISEQLNWKYVNQFEIKKVLKGFADWNSKFLDFLYIPDFKEFSDFLNISDFKGFSDFLNDFKGCWDFVHGTPGFYTHWTFKANLEKYKR
ncbi:hypothetical protein RhiirB3_440639 [Rhizophagus irregularis]|nr:hypothetical protein RhiirB3_440639 [Rhizophagus irregularis]